MCVLNALFCVGGQGLNFESNIQPGSVLAIFVALKCIFLNIFSIMLISMCPIVKPKGICVYRLGESWVMRAGAN